MDPRIAWMKERVLISLDLPEDGLIFDDLMKRDGGKAKGELLSLLDGADEQEAKGKSVTFYSLVTEVEKEVEVEEGEE